MFDVRLNGRKLRGYKTERGGHNGHGKKGEERRKRKR